MMSPAVVMGWSASKAAALVVCPVPPPTIGRPVALARIIADGVPRLGVVITQDVTRQKLPDPDVLPVASADVTAELVTAWVDPAKCARPTPGETAVTRLLGFDEDWL